MALKTWSYFKSSARCDHAINFPTTTTNPHTGISLLDSICGYISSDVAWQEIALSCIVEGRESVTSHPSMVRDRASCPIPFFICGVLPSVWGCRVLSCIVEGRGWRSVTNFVNCAHTPSVSLTLPWYMTRLPL